MSYYSTIKQCITDSTLDGIFSMTFQSKETKQSMENKISDCPVFHTQHLYIWACFKLHASLVSILKIKKYNMNWALYHQKRYTSCGVQVHVHEFPHLGLLPIVISKFRPPILSINVKNSSYSMTIIEKLMPKGDLKLDTFIKKNTENCQHWVLAINIIKKYDAQFLS